MQLLQVKFQICFHVMKLFAEFTRFFEAHNKKISANRIGIEQSFKLCQTRQSNASSLRTDIERAHGITHHLTHKWVPQRGMRMGEDGRIGVERRQRGGM